MEHFVRKEFCEQMKNHQKMAVILHFPRLKYCKQKVILPFNLLFLIIKDTN